MDFGNRTCIDMPENAAFVETLMQDEQSYREENSDENAACVMQMMGRSSRHLSCLTQRTSCWSVSLQMSRSFLQSASRHLLGARSGLLRLYDNINRSACHAIVELKPACAILVRGGHLAAGANLSTKPKRKLHVVAWPS